MNDPRLHKSLVTRKANVKNAACGKVASRKNFQTRWLNIIRRFSISISPVSFVSKHFIPMWHMKWRSEVVGRGRSTESCYRAELGLISAMCALLCVSSMFVVVSAVHTRLSVVANSSGQEFHPAHILSLSRSSMSSSSNEDFIHGEEIQEKEVGCDMNMLAVLSVVV